MNSDDFILHKVDGKIHSASYPFNNMLSNMNLPAIMKGGGNNKGVPIGLALLSTAGINSDVLDSNTLNNYTIKGGGEISNDIYDDLYNKFLNEDTQEKKNKNTKKRTLKTKKNKTKKRK